MKTEVLKAHISINVRNVERSIAFYRQMLGIDPSKVRSGYAKFDVTNPPLNLALNEVPTLSAAGALSHLGFQVASTDDVLAFAPRVDTFLLVVSQGQTARRTLANAKEVLSEVNLMGVVLNRSTERNDSPYY